MRLVDVAQDLGISHAALYKRFPDRASLIDAVSERWLLGVDGSLDAVVKGCESIEERLQLWFRKFHALKRDKVINDPEAYKAFLLGLFAGLRKAEIELLEWRMLDFSANVIHLEQTEWLH